MPARQPIKARPASQPATAPTTLWGKLIFSDGKEVLLSGERALVGRADHDVSEINPEVDLSSMDGADTTSRIHATIEHIGSTYTVTDLNSTNSTRINGKRLEPDKATPISDGDKLTFGKVTCTFKKA
jgi:pSer/pThr/pTyr-binding forkhead associated (FHA) protein